MNENVKDIQNEINDNLKKIVSQTLKDAPITENKGRVPDEEIKSNYATQHPLVKIYVLDSIVNHAKDVFGPYGGLVCEIAPEQYVGGYNMGPSQYDKTKDGYELFTRLEFSERFAQTVVANIQNLTKYISGYDGETSRDGTTSVAMVGCLTAKHLLANRLNKPEIPSTVQNIAFEVITKFALEEMVNKDKISIYNADDCTYVNEDRIENDTEPKYIPTGFTRAINTLRTTVDGNDMYVDAFREVMMTASENGYDLTSAFKAEPKFMTGPQNVEIELLPGIKFRAMPLDESLAGGFKKHHAPTFMLDGYIHREHRDVYVYALKTWLRAMCSIPRGADGYSIFSAEKSQDQNAIFLKPPVLLITRTPDYLQDVYKEIATQGIEVKNNKNGAVEYIKPKIMLANNVDNFEIYYNDMVEVFKDSVIDLNAMDRFIYAKRTTPVDALDESGHLLKIIPQNEVDIAALFPRFVKDKVEIYVPYAEEAVDKAIKGDQIAKFNKARLEKRDLDDLILETGYDGNSFYINPSNEKLLERTRAKRKELIELKSAYSSTAMEASQLGSRLAFFSGVSLRAIITGRERSEHSNMWGIFQDAMGVFESIHVNGILGGSNSYFMRHHDILEKGATEAMNDIFNRMDIQGNTLAKYQEFVADILNAIKLGYANSLYYLMGENSEYYGIYEMYSQKYKEDNLLTYNVVSDSWDTKIIEAARTTADVFAGAVAIAKDMLILKRIRVDASRGEHTAAKTANKVLTLHPMYQKVLSIPDTSTITFENKDILNLEK